MRHRRRYIGQEYDEPYLVSAVPEEVIRSLPPADVAEVRHGRWVPDEEGVVSPAFSVMEYCILLQMNQRDLHKLAGIQIIATF